MKGPLFSESHLMRVHGKVVAQVVEAELCICQVHDVALVSFLSIFHLQCSILRSIL